MARQKKNDGLIEVLLGFPWWANIILGFTGFVALRWILPSAFEGNPFLVALAPVARSFAWLLLVLCGGIAAIVFVRTKAESLSIPDASALRPTWREGSTSDVLTPLSKLDSLWEKAAKNEGSGQSGAEQIKEWSLNALRALEWKRFELLCAKYYESAGFQATTIHCGADGGIDVKLYKNESDKPLAIVQCKAWNTQQVGVKEIRELLGVMVHEKVNRGIFVTTGAFTKDALAFGATNPIQLLDGEAFLAKIRGLAEAQQEALLAFAFDGDYKTPTCPSCGIRMKKRDSKHGPFWGCLHYPRCKRTFPMKS